jgi:hypothetical protein
MNMYGKIWREVAQNGKLERERNINTSKRAVISRSSNRICVNKILMHNTGRIFTVLTVSMTLLFTETGAPLAARVIRILPMNQHP